jgi:hypothetical protein
LNTEQNIHNDQGFPLLQLMIKRVRMETTEQSPNGYFEPSCAPPNVTDEWLALMLRTQKVPGSSLGPKTAYPDRCFVFLHSFFRNSSARAGILQLYPVGVPFGLTQPDPFLFQPEQSPIYLVYPDDRVTNKSLFSYMNADNPWTNYITINIFAALIRVGYRDSFFHCEKRILTAII